jgi:hypothetical protein
MNAASHLTIASLWMTLVSDWLKMSFDEEIPWGIIGLVVCRTSRED